ncbi:hypothetical protein K7432_001964 [Basidiobolus ranarum]|uniref:GCN5-related N-acetyltransferase Rv2170-like domain-containing protein n=1 Tax=Basidiobolus ranarum TaxID=34480 RepID=A0ABR2X260_9FUNG
MVQTSDMPLLRLKGELRQVDVENEIEAIHEWLKKYSHRLPILLGLVRRDIAKQSRPVYFTTFKTFDHLERELGLVVRISKQVNFVVTSEITLRQAPRTETGFLLAEHQRLFDESVKLLEKTFETLNLKVGEEVFIGGLDCMWKPTVWKYTTPIFDTPCNLYSLSWKSFLEKYGNLSDDNLNFDREKYELGQVLSTDLDLVLEHNKIKYDQEYLLSCLEFSRCLRSKETGTLVAWSLTHDNYSISSLHALPSTRRQGLATVVLTSWLHGLLQYYRENFDPDTVSIENRIFHSTMEVWNEVSVNFFTRYGFQPLSIVTWTMVSGRASQE